jgi:hypothetical protein
MGCLAPGAKKLVVVVVKNEMGEACGKHGREGRRTHDPIGRS